MRRSSKLAVLLAACATAFAQASGDSAASVQGIVMNSVTGEPVIRAHVTLSPMVNPQGGQNQPRRYGALSTVEGKFSITGMDPGQYSLAVDKTGFVTTTDVPPIHLQAGDQKNDLKLKLIPTGSITGRVLNTDGEPMENVYVTAEVGSSSGGSGGRTDDRGQYRIGGLMPGKYRVRANPEAMPVPAEIRTDGTKEVHYAATYYPGVLLPREATRAEARAGAETGGVDIRLVRTPILQVSGTVSGLPPGSEKVLIEVRKGRGSNAGAQVKADGTFAVWKLDPGKYTIYAVSYTPGGAPVQSSPADIEVSDANIEHVALHMVPPMELAGRVEFESEEARPQNPPPSPSRSGGTPQRIRRASVPRITARAVDGSTSQTADLGPDDSFHLTGLAPSRYRIALTWGPAYVKSMRLGPTQIDGATVDLRNGAPGNALALVVSAATASLAGTVSNDSGPAAAAIVTLVPAGDGTEQTYNTQTAPDGTYSFGPIPPGSYRIAAFDQADSRIRMRSDNMEDVMDDMEPLELHAGDKLTKDLKRLKP